VPVNVFTTLKSVQVDPSVDFWPNPTWDNDVYNGPAGPKALADKIKVTATYQAINNADAQENIDLIYFWDFDKVAKNFYEVYGAGLAALKTGPYYIFASKDHEETDDENDAEFADNGGVTRPHRPGQFWVERRRPRRHRHL